MRTASLETFNTWINYLRLAERFDEANEALGPLIEAGTEDPYLWGNHIRLLRDSGKAAEAAAALREARRRFPHRGYFTGDLLRAKVASAPVADRSLDHVISPPHEAAVLRRRLRRMDESGVDTVAARATLHAFIEEHLRKPSPSRAVVERSFLHIDDREPERAIRELDDATTVLGSSTELLYAQTRAQRVEAKTSTREYSRNEYRRLVAPFNELLSRSVAARPLRALGAVRAAHALHDGQALEDLQFQNLLQLDETTKTFAVHGQKADRDFHQWWRGGLERLLSFDLSQVTVADADRALTQRARELDGLEEDFVCRLEPVIIGR